MTGVNSQGNASSTNQEGKFNQRESLKNYFSPQTTLPNKLQNKLASFFQKIKIAPGEKSSEIVMALEKVYVDLDINQQEKINTQLVAVLGSFSEAGEIFDNSDLPQVVEYIALNLFSNKGLDKIVITIGMGASETNPSLRLPAIIIPAIKTLLALEKNLKDSTSDKLPKVLVFKADVIGSELNNLNYAEVDKISKLSLAIIKKFVDNFYPRFNNNFIFEQEDKLQINSRLEYLTYIAEELPTLNIDSKIFESLQKMSSKHGQNTSNTSLIYAAAHPYYNGSINSTVVRPFSLGFEPEIILAHGGKPEAIFFEVSRSILQNTPEQTKPFTPYLTAQGKIPTYYQAKGVDYYFGESQSLTEVDLKQIDTGIVVDYKEIFRLLGADAENKLINFYNSF